MIQLLISDSVNRQHTLRKQFQHQPSTATRSLFDNSATVRSCVCTQIYARVSVPNNPTHSLKLASDLSVTQTVTVSSLTLCQLNVYPDYYTHVTSAHPSHHTRSPSDRYWETSRTHLEQHVT